MLDVNKILEEVKQNSYAKVFYFIPCGTFDSNSDFEITIPALNGNRPFNFYISSMQADEFIIDGTGNIIPVNEFHAQEENCNAYMEANYDKYNYFPIGSITTCPSLAEFFHTRDEAEGVGFMLISPDYSVEELLKIAESVQMQQVAKTALVTIGNGISTPMTQV